MNGRRVSTTTIVVILSILLVGSSFSSYTFSPNTDNVFLSTGDLSLIQPVFADEEEDKKKAEEEAKKKAEEEKKKAEEEKKKAEEEKKN